MRLCFAEKVEEKKKLRGLNIIRMRMDPLLTYHYPRAAQTFASSVQPQIFQTQHIRVALSGRERNAYSALR